MYEDVENIFVKVSALVALRLEGHTNLMGIKE